jgi:hypothetical protein
LHSDAGYGFGPSYPVLELDKTIGGEKYIYYGHCLGSKEGRVKAGDNIGHSAGAGCQPPYGNCPKGHIEIGFSPTGAPGATYSSEGRSNSPHGQKMFKTLQALKTGAAMPSGDAGTSSSGGGGGGGDDALAAAKAAGLLTTFQFPGAFDAAESMLLTGDKSLMNDQPLFPFLQELCQGSMRSFMSLPNGDFYAFYPDYFGSFEQQPYWEIDDIEVIEGNITLTDDALATHVYVVVPHYLIKISKLPVD